ncbi:MAG: helix-hairpin-helix domain-containing protein, partial [Planctomycetota bacterium]
MSFNADLADRLETIARLLELTGANRFRVNAFAKAARVIEKETRDVSTLDTDELVAIDGVGKGVAEKVHELRDTGSVAELDELLEEIPPGLLDVMEVQGLGPKTVGQLWKDLGVTDRDSLKKAIDDGSILELPRMGKKTVENITKALAFASKSSAR